MKRLSIIAVALLTIFASCTPDLPKANINDFQLVSGIRDSKLILEGSEGYETTFSFCAKHDWSIIDYKGFSCDPSNGSKCAEGENVVVTAKPLKSNNTADTIFLSDLNFKLLSTRFVGVSAYQLPQVRLPKGNKVYVNALNESEGTIEVVSSSEDITLVTEGEITAKLGEKRDGNRYTISIKATAENSSATDHSIGIIGFDINGVRQESIIEVVQISAIVLDRSEVILPSRGGGQNIFTVESDFEVEVSHLGVEAFTLSRNGNTFTVTAIRDNNGAAISSLGTIEISLKNNPECKRTIEVKQRNGKAPQTIIVHFIGTSLKHYFDHNVKKIIEALDGNIQGNSQVVVITTDASNKATLYEVRYDHNLGKSVQERVKSLELPTPYNSALFEANLREAFNFAPAEKYALVVGSHGLAWVPKISSQSLARHLAKMGIQPSELWIRDKNAEMTRHIGDNESTRYDIDEIADAIEANNVKFDYILFDACFMSNVESLYELRNTANYIIGSPCEVMGYGFPYARIMKYMLTANGTSYDLDKICSEYVDYYKTEATTHSGCVALTKTAELEALAQAMKVVNAAGIKSDFSLEKVQYFEGQSPHSFYDLGHIVELSCADATAATQFKTQLDKTVTSRYHTDRFYSAYGSNNVYYHDINYYTGITTSAMVEHYAYDWSQTEWYKATH